MNYHISFFNFLLDILLISMVAAPIWIIQRIQPFQRGLFYNDITIYYPYTKSTISNKLNVATGAVLNFVFIILVESCRTFYFEPKCLNHKPNGKMLFGQYQCPTILVRIYYYGGYYAFGAFVNASFTATVKVLVGRLRPHFIAVCFPEWGLSAFSYVVDEFIYPTCTGKDDSLLRSARLSFPSGHSSFIWYSMTYAILYMEAQMIWPMLSPILKRIIQLMCVFVAMIVSLSGITDYKHHYEDVVAGSLLGVTVAIIVCVRFVGLFRYPKQPVIFEGITASNVKKLKKRLEDRRLDIL